MNYKDLNLRNEDQPLILKNEVKTESEVLQINKIKKDIVKIKNTTTLINENIKNEKRKINDEIKNKKKELNLYNNDKNSLFEKVSKYTLDKSIIQDELIHSQKKIILDTNEKIKYYQNENIRLSSELLSSQKLTNLANENLSNIEYKNNKIFNQIKDLQNHTAENNIISNKFQKNKQYFINEDEPIDRNTNLDILIFDIFEK
tara:strand:+ start:24 stop:629 length:606 start_codon:yes stop_codon:yes gene_type:complete